MKKTKMIFVSFMIAIALTFGGGFTTTAFASDDDPQGTSGTPKSAPAPQPAPPSGANPDFWATLVSVLSGLFGV